jgi:hypothetical protein
MCWTFLTSDTTILSKSILSEPIKNLRITQAVYGYKRDDLRNIIFIRYEIENISPKNWDGVYIGFYSDTDLSPNPMINRTGYDSTRGLTYTYSDTSTIVTGFTFLETPKSLGVTSHRIMRKNNYIDPDFGEYSFTSSEQILYALKGLSNSGRPMINPSTNRSTLYAFTGDPVSGEGWLDTEVDVRSMISSGPFSLSINEAQRITLVWVVNDGINLQDALTKLKSKVDQIKSGSELWQFN